MPAASPGRGPGRFPFQGGTSGSTEIAQPTTTATSGSQIPKGPQARGPGIFPFTPGVQGSTIPATATATPTPGVPVNPTYNGVQMPVFTLAPNWQAREVTVYQEHATIIREALDVSEERRRTRPRALFGIAYDAMTLSAQETGYHRKVIELAQALPLGCPFWPDMVLLTADSAAGATTLQVDNCNETLFTTLKYALIMDRFDRYEVVRVTGLSADGLTLSLAAATVLDWTAAEDPFTGARVYPLMFGELKRNAFTAINDEESTASIEFAQKQYLDFRDDVPEEPTSAPDLFMIQSPCGEILEFTWTPAVGINYYVLETSPDALTWDIFKDDIDGGAQNITINNPFDAGQWWRLTAVGAGSAASVALHAVPTEVELCAIAIGGCTLLPYTGPELPNPILIPERAIQINPVSNRENPLVAQTSTYLWITARYDFYIDQDASGLYAASIAVTCPTPFATVVWSTDGSDPTIEGPNDHTLPHQSYFGCIVKARAWLNGCYGPMNVVLIDKRVDCLSSVSTQGWAGTAAGACEADHIYYLAVDGHCVGPYVADTADRCSLIYPEGIVNGLAGVACSSLVPGAVSLTKQIFSATVTKDIHYTTDLGSVDDGHCGDYQGANSTAGVSIYLADHISFNRLPFWDAELSDNGQVNAYVCGYFPAVYPQVKGFSGFGGTNTKIETAFNAGGVISYEQPRCAPAIDLADRMGGYAESIYAPAQIILTKDNDTGLSEGLLP